MGRYINVGPGATPLPARGKASALIALGAQKVAPPSTKDDFQPNLVCVVENGMFDAAGFAYSPQEMLAFALPDGRNKTWLVVPDADKFASP